MPSVPADWDVSRIEREMARVVCELSQAACTEVIPWPIDHLPAKSRYAPMKKLLSRSSFDFLDSRNLRKAGVVLRREHRRIYFLYLREFEREAMSAHRNYRAAIARTGSWEEVSAVLRSAFQLLSIAARLRWAGWMSFLPSVDCSRLVESCLETAETALAELLAGQRLADVH